MLFNISTGYIWFGLAILFGIVEIATTSLVSIWFLAGAIVAFLLSFIWDSVTLEIIAFILVSAVTLFYTRPILAKKLLKSTPTNADMLIGQVGEVIEEIALEGHGRIKIDGLTWRAKSSTSLAVGENCVVSKIEGATLIVTKQTVTI